jgi:hypothetical protein
MQEGIELLPSFPAVFKDNITQIELCASSVANNVVPFQGTRHRAGNRFPRVANSATLG